MSRGDFNFLVFNRPEINEVNTILNITIYLLKTVLSHLNSRQLTWINESETLKMILSTAKTVIKNVTEAENS